MRPRSGGTRSATATTGWPGCGPTGGTEGRVGPPQFPPLQRAQIVALACREPGAEGLHIPPWSADDRARQAVADGIVEALSAATLRRIRNDVDRPPPRTRDWRTPRREPRFKERAEKIRWCYAGAERLVQRGIGVVCADEMPNRQVRERRPIRRVIPGAIEQQEFESTRHGTVHILTFLSVHTGRMEATCRESHDAEP